MYIHRCTQYVHVHNMCIYTIYSTFLLFLIPLNSGFNWLHFFCESFIVIFLSLWIKAQFIKIFIKNENMQCLKFLSQTDHFSYLIYRFFIVILYKYKVNFSSFKLIFKRVLFNFWQLLFLLNVINNYFNYSFLKYET